MIRPAFTEIGIFLIPFGVYALFLIATRSGLLVQTSWPAHIVAKLALGSLALVILSFVLLAHFSGAPPSGTVSGNSAGNATDNTYSDFSANPISGNYCFNSDNVTGFISQSGGGGSDCPIAFVYSASKNTLRLLNTKSNKEDVVVCRAQ